MNFNKITYIIYTLLVLLLPLTACTKQSEVIETPEQVLEKVETKFRGVWLSCYELSDMLSDGNEDFFRAEVEKMLTVCNSQSINTVFLQVRPFADSVYPSEIFPFSDYAMSASGKNPDFDILSVFIEMAERYDIGVHAWINPYRISYNTSLSELKKDSIAFNEDYKDSVVCTDVGIYLNPCYDKSRSLVLSGVREILENYNVKGIHIDDYFYPLTEEKFDKPQYDEYCKQGGKLTFAQWRRENVNSLVSSIYSLVHSYGDDLVFSISPAGDIDKNLSSYYADVKLWLRESGYADIIIPQVYYGFEHEKMPFEQVAYEWLMLTRADDVDIWCGLAAYKLGTTDEFAGAGSEEWKEDSNIIERQKAYVDNSAYSGYVLYSYKYIS